MRRDTLLDFFRDLVTIKGDFLVFDDGYRRRRHTYAEVGRAARGFAARLAAAGLTKGDKVVFWGENRPEWIACYWGCLLIGVIVVPIDYRSTPDFLVRVRQLVESRVILVGDDVMAIPSTIDLGGAERWLFADLNWQADGPYPEVPITRDDIIQIIFTSGATADPKGVVIRHRNVLANVVPVEREVMKYQKYAWLVSPLRFLNLLPLSHMFGQSMATNIPPMVRGTVIFTRSFNPHDIVRLIRQRRISVLVCVPKILDVLREHAVANYAARIDDDADGKQRAAGGTKGWLGIAERWWRYRQLHSAFGPKFWAFVVGAAPLPPDVEEFWRSRGFAVIQGYGLTETAPIVTLNHPFRTSKGSVGTPIGGVEIRIADDGEILVRGENVSSGYYDPATAQEPRTTHHELRTSNHEPRTTNHEPRTTNHELRTTTHELRTTAPDGWLHTGDIGERDAEGRIFIKGRKKEMIVTPEGLNVFPEDVEQVLNDMPGVRDSAVVGALHGAEERVHAVLVLDPSVNPDAIVREANTRLQDHQRIRSASVWPRNELPRTEGTRKLKRSQLREWVRSGAPPTTEPRGDTVEAMVARFARGRDITGVTTLEELGLSSLERVELMVALEDRFQTRIDESRFTEAANVSDLKKLLEQPAAVEAPEEPVDFPTWNRTWPVRIIRRLSLATWILPLARVFAHLRVEGLEHLRELHGPVVFASNHQSHFDVPVIFAALPGRWRARVAPAMLKEFFKAHFYPAEHTRRQWFTNSLNYYLASFYFNAFPIPQREAGARHTLRYIGELTGGGWSVLIFPEGVRVEDEQVRPFRGGIGMIASRLDVPVVPVRIRGVNRVLHPKWKFPRPGPVRVAFGRPLRLRGEDYAALAAEVEEAVKGL
jgi:long-chain acyl-CoA synthetase